MNLGTSFCMDAGQVKTGTDAHDTYLKMLQQIVRVTPPVAQGIVAEYPDVHSLLAALELGGPGALQHIKVLSNSFFLTCSASVPSHSANADPFQKSSNASGTFTNASLGPALSKRIYNIFTGTDPGSYDV